MKKLILLNCIFLYSCNFKEPSAENGYTQPDIHKLYSREVLLKDGRVTQCVVSDEGALACDFEHTTLFIEKIEKK